MKTKQGRILTSHGLINHSMVRCLKNFNFDRLYRKNKYQWLYFGTYILKQEAKSTLEIKKSKFITYASHVRSEKQAKLFYDRVKCDRATHNCWAFKIGSIERSADDGEVSGTAGKPILSAIKSADLDYAMVVVTRYYGGIKLGAGGLTRAYGGAASVCLRDSVKQVFVPMTEVILSANISFLGTLYSTIKKYPSVVRLSENLDIDSVSLHVEVPTDINEKFLDSMRNDTSGNIHIEIVP